MNKLKQMIVVDCQNDFITGSLACKNSENAVKEIVKLINSGQYQPLYSKDYHKPTNKSFKINGGIWPIHCVQDEFGSELHKDFSNIKLHDRLPNKYNVFYKGINDEVEEYSAYNARNTFNKSIGEMVENDVLVVGIASEYCVLETIKELIKSGKTVYTSQKLLGYVDKETHNKAMKEYKKLGVKFLD